MKNVPTPDGTPKPTLQSASEPSLSSTTPVLLLQPQPVDASRSPVINRTTPHPSEMGKQPTRSSNRQDLAPEHSQKSSPAPRQNDFKAKLSQLAQKHVRPSGGDPIKAIDESNRVTFALLVEVRELKHQNSVLIRGNERLEAEKKCLESEKERLESENKRLASKKAPAIILRRCFQCQICWEEHREAMVVHIDSCGHCYCRECITSYVGSKLDTKRFPILCPTCATEPRKDKPGVVTDDLVQQIGITAKQYFTWVRLEMTKFAVVLNCIECKRWAFVDKEDFRGTKILTCPFTNCAHRWCKSCQQPVTLYGTKHSCNGILELNHLMKEKGWKYCPGCKTPYQKMEGCDHMTCASPGCNTQFCYGCGGVYNKYGSHICPGDRPRP